MRMIDLIEKKQMGQALTQDEIQYIVTNFTNETIPNYQMAAFMMSVYFQGMSKEEAGWLTMAMAESGDQMDLSAIEGVKVDKHSTGGVGDTTTIILAPLVAACGVPVAKMSGRGLGHTGGTIDKLEAIPGFHTEVPVEDFIKLVNKNKLAVVGQTGNLTPADKKMYALRDVTSTVQSIPLIASSIMSKKIAAGADAIVLDVKVGDGAFMKNVDQARELAQTMVSIGQVVGRQVLAVISDMSQPLGRAVGNALEIQEAIDTLKGHGPQDLTDLCLVLGSQMLIAAGAADNLEVGKAMLQAKIDDGSALAKFKDFVQAQGGNPAVADDPSLLPQAKYKIEVPAPQAGYVTDWVAHDIGVAANLLGAGRNTLDDVIDPAVGLMVQAKIGDYVDQGQSLATIYADREQVDDVIEKILAAVTLGEAVKQPTLIIDTIGHV
ncbi:pyrimidine-nucleoside phosphorylase [Eremococcus coleocola]|uniref:Pyrimidine-nucleoside phosphorylase n=1 Tax=Eremococcus coleocola ACS-139-V-Col8 TaxID=908337 RepID=E4KNR3_9LACT|nr:pyrimidine-nucleoside phosphorylase [Eremococcus coleocola]EFR31427.1 pyrimidine-nucleoside phosphorylase [Eremococcus coleocola ACS-139-V-Col8]